ncbi:MAG: amidohydrolase [Dehalococcoidia bacterium]|nr:amidohydrolase [Dehalococcoidia bacterium]
MSYPMSPLIVDIHTHIFPPRLIEARARLVAADPGFAALYASPRARMSTAEELVASMEGAGVDVSVAAGFWWGDPALRAEHAAYLVEAAARYPGRLVPFVPQPARAAPHGAAGSGEVRLADPQAIEGGALPLLVHCSEAVGHAYPGKAGGLTSGALWRLVDEQPAARVIAAHWGGGFPFYALMPEVRAVIEAGRLVFDTAASPLLYAPEAVRRGIDLVGVRAVCWGSDFPLREQAQDRAAIEAVLGDPSAERDAVLGGNAVRFLGLAVAGRA